MRVLITIYLSISYLIASAQTEKIVTSEIESVTVYLQGAQVTRHFTTTLISGKSELLISNLPARFDERSIQVKTSDESIKVLAVSSKLNYLEQKDKPEKVRVLQRILTQLNSKIYKVKNWLEVYREEESLLKSNKSIGGQQTGVNIEELKQAADYFRSRLADIKSQQLYYKHELDVLSDSTSRLKSQLAELNNKSTEPVREIIIKVSTDKSTTADFALSYLVKEAGWLPSYDVRATNINKPISITYKANVHQNTGEDWKNVRLTFSNTNPFLSGDAPHLNTWYLGFNNHFKHSEIIKDINPYQKSGEIVGQVLSNEDGSPLPGVNILVKGTTIGTVTDLDGKYRLIMPTGAETLVFSFVGLTTEEISVSNRQNIDVQMTSDVKQLSEVVVTGYGGTDNYYSPRNKKQETIVSATPVIRQTTVEFEVEDPYTISSGPKAQLIDMVKYDLPATFQYRCVPKLDADAFLTARITNWEDYNFMEGEASLFFEGKYIGKAILDTHNVEDTLNISLGRDQNIVVTRDRIKNFASEQFIGNNKKEIKAFDIKVRNKKNEAIDILIIDQLPVSNTKDIEVDKIDISGASYNKDTGRLKWELEVAPGETQARTIKYEVKYPKYRYLVLE